MDTSVDVFVQNILKEEAWDYILNRNIRDNDLLVKQAYDKIKSKAGEGNIRAVEIIYFLWNRGFFITLEEFISFITKLSQDNVKRFYQKISTRYDQCDIFAQHIIILCGLLKDVDKDLDKLEKENQLLKAQITAL